LDFLSFEDLPFADDGPSNESLSRGLRDASAALPLFTSWPRRSRSPIEVFLLFSLRDLALSLSSAKLILDDNDDDDDFVFLFPLPPSSSMFRFEVELVEDVEVLFEFEVDPAFFFVEDDDDGNDAEEESLVESPLSFLEVEPLSACFDRDDVDDPAVDFVRFDDDDWRCDEGKGDRL